MVSITLLPLRELLPHEAVSAARVEAVARSILEAGRVFRPLIVDESTGLIVDGHHRYHALSALGARLAPALLVDYSVEIPAPYPPVIRLGLGSLEEAAERIESMAARGRHRIVLELGGERLTLYRDPYEAYHALRSLEGPGPVVARPDPLPKPTVASLAERGMVLPAKSTIHPTPLKRLFYPTRLSLLY